jgi:hypothetical protein
MRTPLFSLILAATVIAFAATTATAQPGVVGPGEPIGPGGPIGPREPIGPIGPGGPNDGGSDIAVYDGVNRQTRVATITRRGSEYRVYSSNRSAAIMTKKGSRVYDGQRIGLESVIYSIRSERLIPGVSSNIANATCTIVGNRFYDGTSTLLSALKYTLIGSRLYEGTSRSLADVKYTISGSANADVKVLLAILGAC